MSATPSENSRPDFLVSSTLRAHGGPVKMKPVSFLVLLAVVAPQTQPPAKPILIQTDIIAVVGCLTQEGTNWVLTNSTEALAKGEDVIALTPEKVKDHPMGKARYRLIGLLDAFNAVGHKGQKMFVKGLFIDGP